MNRWSTPELDAQIIRLWRRGLDSIEIAQRLPVKVTGRQVGVRAYSLGLSADYLASDAKCMRIAEERKQHKHFMEQQAKQSAKAS